MLPCLYKGSAPIVWLLKGRYSIKWRLLLLFQLCTTLPTLITLILLLKGVREINSWYAVREEILCCGWGQGDLKSSFLHPINMLPMAKGNEVLGVSQTCKWQTTPPAPQAGPLGVFCGLKTTELASQLQSLREHSCLWWVSLDNMRSLLLNGWIQLASTECISRLWTNCFTDKGVLFKAYQLFKSLSWLWIWVGSITSFPSALVYLVVTTPSPLTANWYTSSPLQGNYLRWSFLCLWVISSPSFSLFPIKYFFILKLWVTVSLLYTDIEGQVFSACKNFHLFSFSPKYLAKFYPKLFSF